jgi:hypothetical protein
LSAPTVTTTGSGDLAGTGTSAPASTAGTAGVPQQGVSTQTLSATDTGQPPGVPSRPTSAGNLPTLQIGMLTTNNDAASSAGIKNGNTFSERRVLEALVAAYNKQGGIEGRKIDPIYAEIKSSSSNYANDLEAACAVFTQDHHVAAVISVVGLWSEELESCLTKAGVPQVAGDYALGDTSDLTNYPYLVAPTTLSTNQRSAALLRALHGSGYLTPSNKIGAVVEGCPYNERAYNATVRPVAHQLGLTVALEVTSRCFGAIADFGGLASDMQGAVLKFHAQGIDRVMFVSSEEGNLMLLFAASADSQQYFPGYALTSLAIPVVQEANTPKAQLANVKGLGWLPEFDADGATRAFTSPQRTTCLKELRDAGAPQPASAEDYSFAFVGCDAFSLYTRASQVAGGPVSAGQVQPTARALGRSFVSSANYGGVTDFAAPPAGAAQGREFSWSTGCSCFAYTGSPIDLTQIDS